MSELLCNSRALVFPSRWYETQGLVIKEAAAVGVPTIVSDGCAGRDSVDDGETGLWFASGDIKDLNEKLRFVRDQPDHVRRMGATAYERYWKNPDTLTKHGQLLVECYNEILSN